MAVHTILPSALTAAVDEIVVRSRDLKEMRRVGPFDEHGDPVDPLVRFERYDA